jgi:hypothetical protein
MALRRRTSASTSATCTRRTARVAVDDDGVHASQRRRHASAISKGPLLGGARRQPDQIRAPCPDACTVGTLRTRHMRDTRPRDAGEGSPSTLRAGPFRRSSCSDGFPCTRGKSSRQPPDRPSIPFWASPRRASSWGVRGTRNTASVRWMTLANTRRSPVSSHPHFVRRPHSFDKGLFVTLIDKHAFALTRAAPARLLPTLGQIKLVESGRDRPAARSLGRLKARSCFVRHRR